MKEIIRIKIHSYKAITLQTTTPQILILNYVGKSRLLRILKRTKLALRKGNIRSDFSRYNSQEMSKNGSIRPRKRKFMRRRGKDWRIEKFYFQKMRM